MKNSKFYFLFPVLAGFLINLSLCSIGCCQDSIKKCICTKNIYVSEEYPDTVFTFSNNQSLFICGYKEIKNKKTIYSEFVLGQCNADSILNFWGALKNCLIKKRGDTLLIKELAYLPVGNNFAIQQVSCKINMICFKNDQVVMDARFNPSFKKYSSSEIDTILKNYESNIVLNNKKPVIALKKLFVAAVSGNETAKKYFFEMGNNQKENSELSEEYMELKELLTLYEQEPKTKQ